MSSTNKGITLDQLEEHLRRKFENEELKEAALQYTRKKRVLIQRSRMSMKDDIKYCR